MHSFPFRLVSLIWHPFLNLLLSLFNVFLFCFQPPASGEISQSLLDLCLLNFVFVSFFFCKNISTTICWVVSGNCFILFCYVCVLVFFLFLQYRLVQWHCLHNTKVCWFPLVGCVYVCEWEFSFHLSIFYCVTFDLFLCLLFALKLLLTC